jgi:hypothetical protein
MLAALREKMSHWRQRRAEDGEESRRGFGKAESPGWPQHGRPIHALLGFGGGTASGRPHGLRGEHTASGTAIKNGWHCGSRALNLTVRGDSADDARRLYEEANREAGGDALTIRHPRPFS